MTQQHIILNIQHLLHTLPLHKVEPQSITFSLGDEGSSRVLEITPGGVHLDGNIWWHFDELSDQELQQVHDLVREAVDTGDTYMDWENSDLLQAACEDSTIPNVIECAQKYMDSETFHKFLVDIAIKGDS